jgi:uncharacterized protein YjbI with pentapeptide repeats
LGKFDFEEVTPARVDLSDAVLAGRHFSRRALTAARFVSADLALDMALFRAEY